MKLWFSFSHCRQHAPQVSLCTWSVFCLVDLMNPRNWSSDTAWMKRALQDELRKDLTQHLTFKSCVLLYAEIVGVSDFFSKDPGLINSWLTNGNMKGGNMLVSKHQQSPLKLIDCCRSTDNTWLFLQFFLINRILKLFICFLFLLWWALWRLVC